MAGHNLGMQLPGLEEILQLLAKKGGLQPGSLDPIRAGSDRGSIPPDPTIRPPQGVPQPGDVRALMDSILGGAQPQVPSTLAGSAAQTSANTFVGPPAPGPGDQGGGFLQSLLSFLQRPEVIRGGARIGSAAAGPEALQAFDVSQRNTFTREQAKLTRGAAERREAREIETAEFNREQALHTRSGKDRTAAVKRATDISSLPNSTYEDVSPEDQQFVSPNVFRALKNKAAIARIDQVSKLGGLLARDHEASLPKSLQGSFSPDEITIARDIGKDLKETRDLSVRDIKASIIDHLSQPLSAGQVTEITDPVTGERTRTEQVPFQPRVETAKQAEINFREEIAERFEKGEISKDMLNFLAGGKFGNSTKEELDIISLASVMAEVRGIKSKAGILDDMRTIVAAVDPELAKRIPEMFVTKPGVFTDDTALRIPGEGEADKPEVARKVGDKVNTPDGPAVITAINDDGTIEVEFE